MAGTRDGGGARAAHQAKPWWEVEPALLEPTVQNDLEMVKLMAEAAFDLDDPAVVQWVARASELCSGTLVNLWKADGLFAKCRELGIKSLPPRPESWDREAHQLITVTALIAPPRFVREKIGEWLPERAALATFFINTSLFDFEKVYRTFCREEKQDAVLIGEENVLSLFGASSEAGPEACAIDRVTIFETVTLMGDTQTAEIVIRLAAGLTREQVARELDVSTKTIGRKLDKLRAALNKRGFGFEKGRGK